MSTSFLIDQKQPFQHSAFLFFLLKLIAQFKQDVSAIVLQYLDKNLTAVGLIYTHLSENYFILSQIYKEECHCDILIAVRAAMSMYHLSTSPMLKGVLHKSEHGP